jgi:hypothetical protein
VMNFKDLIGARTKRAEKEASKLVKRKRACDQKPKDSTLEVSMPGLVGNVACIGKALEPAEVPDMEGFPAPGVGRAPVAWMY